MKGWLKIYFCGCLLLLGSDVEHEVDDVSILHNVLFPFLAVLTSSLDGCNTLSSGELLEVRVGHHLGLDETPLEVRVDRTRSFGSESASGDRPRTHLVLTGSEEVAQIQHVVSDLHDAGEHRLQTVSLGEEGFSSSRVVPEMPELLLPSDREGDDGASSVRLHPLIDGGKPLVSLAEKGSLVDVYQIHDGLESDGLGHDVVDAGNILQ
mmetsp:Transcript_113602/g.244591  ORF Transcript_113602/g.244591 Transcript_113602/m.244591 type:complete len:208 (+) Transcript_113602:76-699(+)